MSYSYNKYFEEKISQAKHKINDIVLLGDIEISDELYNYLILKVKQIIINCLKSDLKYNDKFEISYLVVQIAIKECDSGALWETIYSVLGVKKVHEIKVRKFICESFYKFTKKNLIFYDINNRNEYRINILMQGVAPNYYFGRFLDFIYDFYKYDLREYYDKKESQEDIENLIQYFSHYEHDDEIDITIESETGSSSKQYLLVKSIRELLKNEPDYMYSLIDKILYYMDYANWKGFLPESNERIEKQFSKWWQEINKVDNSSLEYIVNRKRVYVYKRTFLKYFLSKGKLRIILPEIRIRHEDYLGKAILHVKGNKEYINKRIQTFGMTSKKTECNVLDITDVDDELVVEVFSGDNLIFSSEDRLKRKFIIFDLEGQEIKHIHNLKGVYYILISKDSHININGCQYEKINIKNMDYCIYKLDIDRLYEIIIDDNLPISNQKSSEMVISCEGKITKCHFYSSRGTFEVYGKAPKIIYANDCREKNLKISVNDVSYRLHELQQKVIANYTEINTSCIFKDNIEIKLSIYDLDDQKQISNERIIIMKNLHYSFDKDYYYDCNSLEFIYDFGNGKCTELVDIDANQCSISIPYLKGEILFEIPIIRWKIDNYDWKNKFDYFWYQKIKPDSKLYIDAKMMQDIQVKFDEIINLETYVDNGIAVVDIGSIMGRLIEKKQNPKISFSCRYQNEELYFTLFEILLKPYISEFDLQYDNTKQELTFVYSVLGDSNLHFELSNVRTKQIIVNEYLNNDEYYSKKINLLDGIYCINIYYKEEDEFGIKIESQNIFNYEFIVGDKLIIKSNENDVSVKNIMLLNEGMKDVRNFYLANILYDIKLGVYRANAYFKLRNGRKQFFTTENPVIIEFINEKNYYVSIFANTEDGFMYEKHSKHIVNRAKPDLNGKKQPQNYDFPEYYVLEFKEDKDV